MVRDSGSIAGGYADDLLRRGESGQHLADTVLAQGAHAELAGALAELGVVSPLRRAGLTKDEVRALGRSVGVSLADKPSFSCYAVHAPAGQPLTEEALHQVTALFDA